MNEFISLEDAVSRLNVSADGAGSWVSVTQLIEAGAEGRLNVFWRNSRQVFTTVFSPEGKESGKGVTAARLLRLSMFDLARLEDEESINTSCFEPLDEERQLLAEGGLDGVDVMRWTVEPGSCVVSRSSLRVRAVDIESISGELPVENMCVQRLQSTKLEPVKWQMLNNVFRDPQWGNYHHNACRIGLSRARVSRGRYDPLKAGLWWVAHTAQPGWTPAKVHQVVQEQFQVSCGEQVPANVRSVDPFKHLAR